MSKFDKNVLTPCPVLRPTDAEFMDPIGYLSSPAALELGRKYGLVKVVPPESWKPSFQISPHFKFHVRQQVISDLGITTRSRKFFKENINRFLNMRRKRLLKLFFKVDGHTVYYYDLYALVEKMGGFQEMTKPRWQEVNTHFGIDLKSKAIELEYNATIKNYANYLNCNKDVELPESDSEIEIEDDEQDSDHCLICGDNDNPEETLLCDHCDGAFHMACLNPPLTQVPATNWYCDKCLIGTGEYGFEEDPEIKYSIPEFYRLCKEFDKSFFEDYNNGLPMSVDEIENKFWSFVDIEKSDLEVKYGADIHNLKPGEISGFPMKTTPGLDLLDPKNHFYINHPYNLTKLPFAKGSLLNYINTSISGMTVPWIYIGSLLSTFCWHVEDHYTLSANYCHFGAVKKWYGIPSSHSTQFETLMRDSAPDLFQKQPDLLHQLTTLMNPMKLVENGIPCVYADQNPNEFVITYPKVYHAGFNCGFNFNEAVNFAMDEWLEFGEQSITNYKPIGKENVFNFYELVENIIKQFVNEGNKNLNDGANHSLDMIKRSTKIFANFLNKHDELLKQIHKFNLNIQFRPKVYRAREFELEQSGKIMDYSDEEEDLCFGCKTHLGFQYCILGEEEEMENKDECDGVEKDRLKAELYSNTNSNTNTNTNSNTNTNTNFNSTFQLPTPHASPQEENIMSRNKDAAKVVANSNSSEELSHYSVSTPKCVMDEYDELIQRAKRKGLQEPENDGIGQLDLQESAPKRRKSSRLQTIEEQQFQKRKDHAANFSKNKLKRAKAKAKAKAKKFGMRKMNERTVDHNSKKICLECITKRETIPKSSIVIYQNQPEQMRELLTKAELKIMSLEK